MSQIESGRSYAVLLIDFFEIQFRFLKICPTICTVYMRVVLETARDTPLFWLFERVLFISYVRRTLLNAKKLSKNMGVVDEQ